MCLGAFNGDQAGLPVMGCAVSSCIRQGDGLIECLNVGGVRRAIHGGARTLGVVRLVHSYILVSPCRNVLWVLRCTEAVSCVRCSFFIRLSVAISKGGANPIQNPSLALMVCRDHCGRVPAVCWVWARCMGCGWSLTFYVEQLRRYCRYSWS